MLTLQPPRLAGFLRARFSLCKCTSRTQISSSGPQFLYVIVLLRSIVIMCCCCQAGGPYHCAEGDISKATTTCMSAPLGPPNVNNLVTATRTKAAAGQIAAVSNLEGSAAFLWGGNMVSKQAAPSPHSPCALSFQDYTVRPVVMKAAADYYHALGLVCVRVCVSCFHLTTRADTDVHHAPDGLAHHAHRRPQDGT